MLEVKNLNKSFDMKKDTLHAVKDVSFKVEDGEIFGIIGSSGAGKSTLVRLINRLEEPDSGEIIFNGDDILKLDKNALLNKRKEISMIFQSFNLFNQKTVYKNMSYPMEISNYSKEEIDKKVNDLLEFIGLKDKKYNYPTSLSGGERQRVAIARALALNPKLILSDESTSALDPNTTRQILSLLRKIVKKYNTTILLITHQMEVAKEICDRIAVMNKGEIVEISDVKTIFENPQNELTKSFINNLRDDINEDILKKDYKGRLIRIVFNEETFDRPIISDVIKNTSCDLNIISGNLNTLSSKKVGSTIAEIIYDGDINDIIEEFEKYRVKVEVIK